MTLIRVAAKETAGVATRGRFRGGFFLLYLLSVFVTNNTNPSNRLLSGIIQSGFPDLQSALSPSF